MVLGTEFLWTVAGVSLVLGWLLVRRVLDRWHVRRRIRKAKRGERDAVRLLRDHGYKIVALQAHKVFAYTVDGVRHKASVRCDILAKRHGKTFVVEVKTGQQAHPGSVSTRRQLSEYARVFKADGLLLADMDRRRLHRLVLSEPGRIGRGVRVVIFAIAVLVAAAAAYSSANKVLGSWGLVEGSGHPLQGGQGAWHPWGAHGIRGARIASVGRT